MENRYFVKFIGTKNVTLAVARNQDEAVVLQRNQFEETTQSFYSWVQSQTQTIR
ncbi:MAG: hypothetical protein WBC91_16910 [Phototrophicaceae bacterium]